MSSKATVALSFSPKSLKELEKATKKIEEDIAMQLASEQIANIQLRVAKGIGLNDSQMPDYSPSYKRYRKKKGRDSSVRKLEFTGRMLNALFAEKLGEKAAKIYFLDAQNRMKAYYNQRRIEWFGISEKDRGYLMRSLEKKIAQINKEK